jgi:alpha-L-arabinofuranosidase
MKKITFCILILISIVSPAFSQGVSLLPREKAVHLILNLNKPGVDVSPLLYGLMTEEINHSYDGGLYAELIQNRIFRDKPDTAVHWTLIKSQNKSGSIVLDNNESINNALAVCLKLTVSQGRGKVGIANDGYWGIPVRHNAMYSVSFYTKSSAGIGPRLNVRIESNDGKNVYAAGTVVLSSNSWKKYTLKLKTNGKVVATKEARFVIVATTPGKYWFNLVSLFPPTFNNRPNGNRIDLMELQKAMQPRFLRFPGGDYLEGKRLEDRFAFKNTIHDISQRPGKNSRWYYRSSDGMGLLEFLEWCEDLNMEPLLAVYAGYSVGEGYLATGNDLKPFVDEALEEIEYIIGDKKTKYGAMRVADGHPKPFNLGYVEIGNEDFFDRSGSYEERFSLFFDAIREKYPQLKIIATAPIKSRSADLLDEHFYRSPEAMRSMAKQYDNYNRTDIPIIVGEWASQEGTPITNMNSALGDAAWMLGLERNSDIVKMSCYAPMFANINKGAFQWGWNLIGYDALTGFGAPSYYTQVMFNSHLGDKVISLIEENIPEESWQAPKVANKMQPVSQKIPTFFAGATEDSKKGLIYLKLVNSAGLKQSVRIDLKGGISIYSKAESVVLSSKSLKDLNTIAEPQKIVPINKSIHSVSRSFEYVASPYSITVLTIKVK